jgi:hypothetical protein
VVCRPHLTQDCASSLTEFPSNHDPANGGIGFELLASPTNLVLLGSRSLDKGSAALQDLKSRNLPGTVDLVHIDVDSDESIHKAAHEVEKKHGRYAHHTSVRAVTGA